MAKRQAKLSKRTIDTASPESARYAIHDPDILGFKLYVHPSGKKVFHLRYRVGGGRGATIREPKIGDFGAVTPDQACKIAGDWVIPPFLVGVDRRIHAVALIFWAGVIPPMPMFGRSLLQVHSHCVAKSWASSMRSKMC
jgi:hypothetical protein